MTKQNLLALKKVFFFSIIILSASCQHEIEQEGIVSRIDGTKPFVEQKVDAFSSELNAGDAFKVAMLYQKSLAKTTRASSKRISNVIPVFDDSGRTPLFYVVNFANNNGYVIISGTKKTAPILAYSERGNFENIQEQMGIWLEELKCNLALMASDSTKSFDWGWLKFCDLSVKHNSTRSFDNKELWKEEIIREYKGKSSYAILNNGEEYSSVFTTLAALNYYMPYYDKSSSSEIQEMIEESDRLGFSEHDILCQVFTRKKNFTFGPLLNTQWHQEKPYNGAIDGVLGCTTIAAGQFMNYYRLPSSMNWGKISQIGSSEQQNFLKQVGEKIGIDYSSSERGAMCSDVFNALKEYGYDIDVTDELSKTGISKGQKPVICLGYTSQVLGFGIEHGHAWVIDGENSGYEEIIVDIYAPLKQQYVSHEVLPDENPYICINHHPSYLNSFCFYHMNWGGSESWNTAGDYTWSGTHRNYKRDKKFIFMR